MPQRQLYNRCFFSSLALSEKSNHTHWVESRLIISPALTLCTPWGPLHFNYKLTRRTYTQGHQHSLLANQKYYKNLITRTKKHLMQSVLHQSAFSYFAVNGFCRLFVMLVRMMPGNVILLFICVSSGIRMSASSTSLLQNSIQVFQIRMLLQLWFVHFYKWFLQGQIRIYDFFLISKLVLHYIELHWPILILLYSVPYLALAKTFDVIEEESGR